MSYAFFYSILSIYTLQSFLDILCMLTNVFHPFYAEFLMHSLNLDQKYWQDTHADIYFDGMEVFERYLVFNTQQPSFFRRLYYKQLLFLNKLWFFFLHLYSSSLFFHPEVDALDAYEYTQLKCRYFMYSISSISIVRFFSILEMKCHSFCIVSFLYFYEALIFEYEGFTAKSMHLERARFMSIYSYLMCICSFLLCIWTYS